MAVINRQQEMSKINVGRSERVVSLITGTLMMLAGIDRGDLPGLLLTLLGGKMLYRGVTGHSPTYRMLGMNTAVETNPARVSVPHKQGIRVDKTFVINSTPDELYRFWRNFENLPRFMNHLESVNVIDSKRSHWVAKGPAGLNVSWDAEIIHEVPNEVIGWRSLANAQVPNAGSVRFRPAPDGRGTVLSVEIEYTPPAGPVGAAFAKLFGEEPNQQVEDDLNRLKELMEQGETSQNSGNNLFPL